MISDFIKIAVKNMKKRRLRSFLTLIGILIAIATIFVLISVSLGLQGAVEEQFRLLGTDKFFIQPRGTLAGPGTGGAVDLTEEDVKVVEKIAGVKRITFWTLSPAKLEFNDETRFVNVIGIDLEGSELLAETKIYDAEQGQLLSEGDEGKLMIGSQYSGSYLNKQVSLGDKLTINGKDFKVRGILKTIGNPSDDRLIYMPLSDFRSLFNIPERVDTIIAQTNTEENIKEVADRTERKLIKSRNVDEDNPDFTILTPEELLESFGVILNIITAFLLGVAGISLLVGGIGIANTMFTSVLERTREIGVMKAVGAKNSDILIIFLIEAGLLGLIGGALGVIFGILITYLIEYIAVNQLGTTLLQTATPFYLIFGCLAFAFLAGAISGLWPAYRAIKVKPVEALRYE